MTTRSRPSRRQVLIGAALAAAAAGAPLAARNARSERTLADGSIGAAARRSGFAFGSAFGWGLPGADRGAFANPSYAALIEAECAVLVPENEMKWQQLRPTPTTFDFSRFDAMMAYAQRQGFAVRGHTLLWHQTKWMPKWEATHDFGARPATAGANLLTSHISAVCKRYGDAVYSYDVVNEAVNPEDSTLYDTALSRAIGGPEATLDLAFHAARSAAPHAQLVYNDYMSWEPGNTAHCAGVLRLLEGFRRRATPVDALGIQSHLVTQGRDAALSLSAQQENWRRFLDAVTAMGYRLSITEFDVRDNNLPADLRVRDKAVADYARAYLDVMLDYPQLKDMLVWGMSDRYSWIEGFEPRADGVRRRPSPYDAEFQRKPLHAALRGAFAAARQR